MNPTQRFRDALAPERRGDIADDRELGAALAELTASGRAAHPTVSVDDGALAAFVAARLPAGDGVRAGLAAAPAGDLVLACAALAGDLAARAAVIAMIDEVDAAATAAVATRAEVGDVRAHLRAHLFAGEAGGEPMLARYGGRGPLRGWLRIVATRELLRSRGQSLPTPPATMMSTDASMGGDRPHAELDEAVAAALDELSPRERTLLRLAVLDRLDVERIGAIHGVHGGTATRWLDSARAALVAAAQRRLAASAERSTAELGRLLRSLRGQLDGRVERLLRYR